MVQYHAIRAKGRQIAGNELVTGMPSLDSREYRALCVLRKPVRRACCVPERYLSCTWRVAMGFTPPSHRVFRHLLMMTVRTRAVVRVV